MQQGGHYFFRLWSLSLSRKASNAITKLPKAISKPITPMNIKMISAAVIGATSLPMYSGKPVIGSGGYHPCHGFHEWILSQYDANFNRPIHHRKHFPYALLRAIKKNSLELSAALCYPLDRKRRLLVTGAPIGAPLQRWSFPSEGSYLSVRGAHPGANRVGIIFFACGPCLCRERQATL